MPYHRYCHDVSDHNFKELPSGVGFINEPFLSTDLYSVVEKTLAPQTERMRESPNTSRCIVWPPGVKAVAEGSTLAIHHPVVLCGAHCDSAGAARHAGRRASRKADGEHAADEAREVREGFAAVIVIQHASMPFLTKPIQEHRLRAKVQAILWDPVSPI
jgi:hypothetical protein